MADSELRLLLVARADGDTVQQVAAELTSLLQGEPGVLLISQADWESGRMLPPPDLVVVLGGDGSILRACHRLGREQRPILGINLGRLGFLADLTPEEFRARLPQIKQRQFQIVEHLMFECAIHRADGTSQTFLGLNETIICAAAALQMIEVRLSINGEPVTNYSCDGLVVSTPVGSTAHSLAAGGPMVRQNLPAFVITPICPHSLSNRPLVDHADCVYSLSLADTSRDALLVVDGQDRVSLRVGDVVTVSKAPVTFKLAKLPGQSYYSTLHRKLGWSGQPNYPARPMP